MSSATSWQMPSFDDLLPNAGGVAAPVPVPGIVTPGNVDLATRPTVPMPDGSIATVRSMSFNDGEGREVLIPTISDDGRLLSDDEAIALYRQSGRHLGIFATPDDATAYAKQLSQQQGRDYGANTGGWQMPSFDDLMPKQSLPAAVGNALVRGAIVGTGQNIEGLSRTHLAAQKNWADDMLHAVGMLAVDDAGPIAGIRAGRGLPYFGMAAYAQMTYIVEALKATCAAGGTAIGNVVRIHQFHTDLTEFYAMHRPWQEALGGSPVPFTAVRVPPTLPVPACSVLVDPWVYAP